MTASTSALPLEAAFPSPERVAEVRAQLEEAGVRFILSCWVDILGVPKTKPVPVRELETLCRGRGPQFAVHSVTMFPELGPSDPDQVALPDLDSVTICPWDTTVAWIFADLYIEGEPYNVCPRLALKRQITEAAEAGYQVLAGFEPEFSVYRERDGELMKAFGGADDLKVGNLKIRRQAYGYDVEHSLDGLPFLDDIVQAIDTLGWGLTNVVCEGSYSQFELDYGFGDAVQTADRFCFLRVMLKEIAKRHGLVVSYMPKPMNGDWRNGAHINHSFVPAGGGENLLRGADGQWSELALNAIGGLVRHGGAITAVACPTVNSYKGLLGHTSELEGGTLTWAPTHMCYGHNNRSAMIRLPQGRPAIENRACDMSVNPYLALAMTIGATVEGLVEKIPAGKAIDKPLYDVSDEEAKELGIKRLPRTLLEAVELFDADPLAKKVFGGTMHKLFSRHKHDEWNRYHEHVSEWEQAEYLRFF
ncbi:MAG: glutamine synthetase [Mycobacterium sp.]